jgi:hypothetical protein
MPSLPLPRSIAARLSAMVALAAAAALAATAATSGVARASTLPVNYDFIAAVTTTALAPATPPPGANDFACKPAASVPARQQ